MSYYDIDAILTDAQVNLSVPVPDSLLLSNNPQKLPCTFEVDVPGLGYLESSSSSPDIKAGTRLQLPVWLAEMLAVSQRLGTFTNVITLDVPTTFAPRVQNALKADPRTVELRSLATHFYGLGERVLALFEEDELCEVLITVSAGAEEGLEEREG
jgi:GINS complex subunit 3